MSRAAVAVALLVFGAIRAGAMPLDLAGYAAADGSITVQRAGATIDPYFALQALLVSREEGLDGQAYAVRWFEWLAPRQKLDGTFDRFCRAGPVWLGCKGADADDALLALWLKFLDGLPAEVERRPAWQASRAAARTALARLFDPQKRIYLVSPVFQHGLFMDNLEVWSYRGGRGDEGPEGPALARAIRSVFWDAAQQRFLVSTQPEQRTVEPRFYPDAVAQVYPLVVGFPQVPGGAAVWYKDWMRQHRREWLAQVQHDFAWGLLALVAVRQGDSVSAACWLRVTRDFRHGPHWTVTDEVVAQALAKRGVRAAPAAAECR